MNDAPEVSAAGGASNRIAMRSHLAYRFNRLTRSVLARMALHLPRLGPYLATPTPLVKMEYPGGTHSTTLIVFLPGIDDLAEDFERRGIIDDMRQFGITVDAVAVDAHYGYYAEEVIFERITDDVIDWARLAGYTEIWLAGISLGGFGAALYAVHHPSKINGLLLLAPYLGDDALIREIAAAGGATGWDPGPVRQGDYQRALWAWFKRRAASGQPEFAIYLGYGTEDKFARANALLAMSLPPNHILSIAGGHDWRTWKELWRMFLRRWKREPQ